MRGSRRSKGEVGEARGESGESREGDYSTRRHRVGSKRS